MDTNTHRVQPEAIHNTKMLRFIKKKTVSRDTRPEPMRDEIPLPPPPPDLTDQEGEITEEDTECDEPNDSSYRQEAEAIIDGIMGDRDGDSDDTGTTVMSAKLSDDDRRSEVRNVMPSPPLNATSSISIAASPNSQPITSPQRTLWDIGEHNHMRNTQVMCFV